MLFISALLPVFFLVGYIYRADRLQHEPLKQIVRATLLGIASCFLSFCFSVPFGEIGLYTDDYTGIFGAFFHALFAAAVPEELAKLIILYFVVRKNQFFDEKMDGIVYAVCVGMGFAGLENLMYVAESSSFLTIAIFRAIFAVPGHFCFAVFMGYYFSKYWFERKHRMRNLLLALLAPVAAHTLYDFILMYNSVAESVLLNLILIVAFGYSCYKTYRWALHRIDQHLADDERNNY